MSLSHDKLTLLACSVSIFTEQMCYIPEVEICQMIKFFVQWKESIHSCCNLAYFHTLRQHFTAAHSPGVMVHCGGLITDKRTFISSSMDDTFHYAKPYLKLVLDSGFQIWFCILLIHRQITNSIFGQTESYRTRGNLGRNFLCTRYMSRIIMR